MLSSNTLSINQIYINDDLHGWMTNTINDEHHSWQNVLNGQMDVINVNLINDNLHLCKINNDAVINCNN